MLYETYNHSVASANAMRQHPSTFVYKWGLRNWDAEPSPSMLMGRACHTGLQLALVHDLSDDDAIFHAKAEFDQYMQGELVKQRECIQPILLHWLQRLRPLGQPSSVEEVTIVDGAPYGLKYPVKVVTDLRYPDMGFELKATMRCPSKIGDFEYKHICQAVSYATVLGMPFHLLYASHANCLHYTPGPAEMIEAWADMLASWRAIEALDRAFATPQEAMEVIPFCAEAFYDPGERRQARKAWNLASAMGDELTIMGAG